MDKRRVNVRGIIWRDGKLLAVKLACISYNYEKDLL